MHTRLVLVGAALAALFPGHRLPAQDATVGAVGWFRSEGVPDQPPQAKRRLRVDYPDELRKSGEAGYAIVYRYIDADGQSLTLQTRATHLSFQRAVEDALVKSEMKPATRDGRPVAAQFWIPVIFNPASASPDRPDATPRLLTVAPVIVSTRPPGGEAPVWALIRLDEAGVPVAFDVESPAAEVLWPAIGKTLKHWRFAPARKGGQPVAASIRVAFLCFPPMNPVPLQRTPPRVLTQEPPIYPLALEATGLRGEVEINFVVDQTGKVVDPVVGRSSNPAFDQPAIAAVLQWTFAPAQVDGHPAATRMKVPILFEPINRGREAYLIEAPGRRAQAKLPEELRFDTPPKPRGAVIPVYPYGLLHDDAYGEATVIFAVNAAGDVVETRTADATRPEFGLALAAAVESFKFDPALRNGQPVASVIRMKQQFDPDLRGSKQTVTNEDRVLLKREKKRPATIISGNKLDAPLKPLSRRPPVFPLALRDKADGGSATIEALVDDEGHVRLPRVVAASDPAFGYAAVQAAAAWLFEPPRSGGKPAVVRVQIPFAFEMKHGPRDDTAGKPPQTRDGK